MGEASQKHGSRQLDKRRRRSRYSISTCAATIQFLQFCFFLVVTHPKFCHGFVASTNPHDQYTQRSTRVLFVASKPPPLSTTTSSDTSTSTDTDTQVEYFQSLTVKELKQLVKEQSTLERGVLSKLKKKQDFIDYLMIQQSQQQQPQQSQPSEDDGNTNDEIILPASDLIQKLMDQALAITEQLELVQGDEDKELELMEQLEALEEQVEQLETKQSTQNQQDEEDDEFDEDEEEEEEEEYDDEEAEYDEEDADDEDLDEEEDDEEDDTSSPTASMHRTKPSGGPLKMPAFTRDDEEEIVTVHEEHKNADSVMKVNGSTTNNNGAVEPTKSINDNNNHMSGHRKKTQVMEQLFQRYPPLREQYDAQQQEAERQASDNDDDNNNDSNSNSGSDEDMRQLHHPIFQSTKHVASSDMDIVFVGTASCTPGVTRGVSCTALRLNWSRRGVFKEDPNAHAKSEFRGGTWLFDVGECTQLSVQRTSSVKPSKITKIFLTHAHGDHTFGLPGLLCLMGQDRASPNNANVQQQEEPRVVDIYGPQGLRKWLRVAIRYSVSRIVPPYRVHELHNVPMAPEWQWNSRASRFYYNLKHNNNRGGSSSRKPWGSQGLAGEDPQNWISQADRIALEPSTQYGEVQGGRDIYPIYGHPLSTDGAPVWEVEDEGDVKIHAAPMSHGIPCVGYVVEEASRPGRLRNEIVEPMVRRNVKALKEAGFNIPMKAMAVIKNLPVGSAFTFPDGTSISQEEAVEAPRKGRKVVICGDTASSRSLEKLAQDCDVLVHESTNAYLKGIDRDTNLRMVTRDAVIHGHSTPEIAGLFAKRVGAKRLLLNHFSARYKGDPSLDSMSIMTRIEQGAMAASGLNETNVAAAWDLMLLPIPAHQQ